MENTSNTKESFLYTHKEFLEFIQIFKKDKLQLSKLASYPLYIFSFFIVFMFYLSLYLFVALMSGLSRRYPSDKYKKVVKEGILWDSVEWHER